MLLNGLGSPDETTLIPLKTVEPIPPDLNVIRECIQQAKENDNHPLVSNKTEEEKNMLFQQLEYNKIRNDAVVDSGAYINVIRGRDAEKNQK